MLIVNTTIEWLGKFNEKIQENKAYLSELDGPIGDGDHGANMARGMSETMKALEGSNFENVSEIFKSGHDPNVKSRRSLTFVWFSLSSHE